MLVAVVAAVTLVSVVAAVALVVAVGCMSVLASLTKGHWATTVSNTLITPLSHQVQTGINSSMFLAQVMKVHLVKIHY